MNRCANGPPHNPICGVGSAYWGVAIYIVRHCLGAPLRWCNRAGRTATSIFGREPRLRWRDIIHLCSRCVLHCGSRLALVFASCANGRAWPAMLLWLLSLTTGASLGRNPTVCQAPKIEFSVWTSLFAPLFRFLALIS